MTRLSQANAATQAADPPFPSVAPAGSADLRDLLTDLIATPSVSGDEANLTRNVCQWAQAEGFQTDLWQADESQLAPHALANARHLPLAGRPTLVIRLPGSGGGRNLIFNAHSDVVAAPQPERWRFAPFSGHIEAGRAYGRGACDVKGALTSALLAMRQLRREAGRLAGDVMLELVPGEEDCVGLGTLTSVIRGYTADAAIVLEPTQCEPRCASRAGLRFEVSCEGRAVHGTVKWEGRDAIRLARQVIDALDMLERQWNDRAADELFGRYPLARPVTLDSLHGGQWQGMLCDHCVCAGYFELLPGDDIAAWQQRFDQELRQQLPESLRADVRVAFSEQYSGHRTDPSHPLVRLASRVAGGTTPSAFNSGCEAGLRATVHDTPTLVWGPGSLSQAHALDEYVELDQVARCVGLFASTALDWCGPAAPQTPATANPKGLR